QLAHGRANCKELRTTWVGEQAGAPERIRTCDLCLRRAALYPAELRVPFACIARRHGAPQTTRRRRNRERPVLVPSGLRTRRPLMKWPFAGTAALIAVLSIPVTTAFAAPP